MRTAYFASPLIPPAWVAAHGWRPCRLRPTAGAGAPAPAGACPFSRAWLAAARAQAAPGDALIMTTECDQMRRLAEDAAPEPGGGPALFLFHIPCAIASPVAPTVYRSELDRLGRFLIREGGHPPAPGSLRAHLRAASTPRPPADTAGIPLALVGAPLLQGHEALLDLIRRSGGRVALDATETGELSVPPPLPPVLLEGDPLAALVSTYLGEVPCVHHRPNDALYVWLGRRLRERAAHGLILLRYPWCDAWHAEAARLRQWSPVPVLDGLLSAEEALPAGLATRVEAFLEALR